MPGQDLVFPVPPGFQYLSLAAIGIEVGGVVVVEVLGAPARTAGLGVDGRAALLGLGLCYGGCRDERKGQGGRFHGSLLSSLSGSG
jgi:hypothetical protein